MNRRNFCKLASLAAVGALMPKTLTATTSTPANALPRCRVDVLRRACFTDLQSRYLDDPEAGPCPHFTVGQSFTIDSAERCPSGFCPKAWASIQPHVQAVIAGRGDNCGASTADRAVIACCADGTRPVIFKITPT